MSSVEYLREFVNKRLTAAAEEIFGVFNKTIIEYEEEINRQRKLLDIVLKPEINVHRIDLPWQHACKEEEVLSDHLLRIQERNSSLDQEDPEPPQIKEEQEELCTSQEGEQLELKQETDYFMLTPTYDGSDHSEDPTLNLKPDTPLSASNKESAVNIPVIGSVVSEAHIHHQLLAHNSREAESRDKKGGQCGDSGPMRNPESKLQERLQSHTNNLDKLNLFKIHRNAHTGKALFQCDICGIVFKYKSPMRTHLRVHTGGKIHSCHFCGKRFARLSEYKTHVTTHTGEKPYSCKTCGKKIRRNHDLVVHMRIHTGEKPYSCETCGKGFARNSSLLVHMRRAHTGEMPYLCNTCGKRYFDVSQLARHRRKSHPAT